MRDRAGAGLWIVTAFCAALAMTGLVFAILGPNEKGAVTALRALARLAFLFFLAAYAGGALATLFGSAFEGLARRGREFGLAFAATLTVHLGVAIWYFNFLGHAFVASPIIIAEIIGVCGIFVLTAFSIKRLREAINPHLWRWMRVSVMEYVALVFAYNFFVFPFKVAYLPFFLLIVGAMILRLAAALRHAGRPNRRISP